MSTSPVAPDSRDAEPLRAVLVDVGGTLWPDRWPSSRGTGFRAARVREILPFLSLEACTDLVTEIERTERAHADDCIRAATQACGVSVDTKGIIALRRAGSRSSTVGRTF